MVAIDEGYWGGDDYRRLKTIPELCTASGPLYGIARCEMNQMANLVDYETLIYGLVAAYLFAALVLGYFYDLGAGIVGFAFASLMTIIVAVLMVVRRNILLAYRLQAVKSDPQWMAMSATMFDHYLNFPAHARLCLFRASTARYYHPADLPFVTINRSDEFGNFGLFLRFDDDHDRVMFRLTR